MPLTRGQLTEAIAGIGPVATKTVTFAGGTANAIGDYDGTGNPTTLFTVTGDVLVKIFAYATTAPVGTSATLQVGVSGGTAELLPITTATDIAIGDVWIDATPATKTEDFSAIKTYFIGNGQDIIQTVATANITAGVVKYICIWKPLSADGNVEAA